MFKTSCQKYCKENIKLNNNEAEILKHIKIKKENIDNYLKNINLIPSMIKKYASVIELNKKIESAIKKLESANKNL